MVFRSNSLEMGLKMMAKCCANSEPEVKSSVGKYVSGSYDVWLGDVLVTESVKDLMSFNIDSAAFSRIVKLR